MPSSFFRFKQFIVHQDKSAMKVGTDGVLLGAWTGASNACSILDIGTGTGLIALMLAQVSQAKIDAIDVDKNSCEQALENISLSPWNDRINIIHKSFQEYQQNCHLKYDLLVSNPPFFINSLKSGKEERNLARHNDALPFHDIIAGVLNLLAKDGRFCIILPFTEGNIFIDLARECLLFCSRKTHVSPCPWKSPTRLLIEFRRESRSLVENSLTIEMDERHSYSAEFVHLTRDFYLKH